jgi:mitogen-activated protein kinase 1/3
MDVIGEGAYGVVVSALHRPTGQKVAIKKVSFGGSNAISRKER